MSISSNSIQGSPFSTKGGIYIHNGTTTQLLTVGASGFALASSSSVTATSLTYKNPPVGDSVYYEKIASTTLTTVSTSVSFSSITSGYKDLYLIVQARNTSTGTIGADALAVDISFNTDTAASNAKYSSFGIRIHSALRTLENLTSQDKIKAWSSITSASNTVGTWGMLEMKINQYTNTATKVGSYFSHSYADNSTNGASLFHSLSYSGTLAIDRINLTPSNGGSFTIDSKFILYGSK
jgi:hypothetical protein